MGLENLKSAFSKLEKMDRTDLSKLKSEFQSGPTHPQNDGIYNPISEKELAGKDSKFNDIVPQSFDPLMGKTSEFQSGPTFNEPSPDPSVNNLTAPSYPTVFDGGINSDFGNISDSQYQVILSDNDSYLTTQETPILNEYQKFNYVGEGADLFKTYFYDPRTPKGPNIGITKQGYAGTSKTKINLVGGGDSGIGGIFNSDGLEGNKYSVAFRTINTPTLDELITKGNWGNGYLAAQGFYDKYLVVQQTAGDVNNYPRYYEPGSGLNLANSSWYTGGDTGIAPVNDLTAGTFQQFNSQTRTVRLDGTAIQANELKETGGWEALYNADGSDKGFGYSYPNVDRSKLKYGDGNSGFRGNEPYIRKPLGGTESQNWPIGYSRSLGFMAAGDDLMRLGNFLTSGAGGRYLVRQNILGFGMSEFSPYGDGANLGLGLLGATAFSAYPGYPGGGKYLSSFRRNFPFNEFGDTFPYQEGYLKVIEKQAEKKGMITVHFHDKTQKKGQRLKVIFDDTNTTPVLNNVNTSMGGKGGFITKPYFGAKDTFTSAPTSLWGMPTEFESSKHGMPMYFRDLRTGQTCMFRAFLEGLSENIAPSWQTQDYPGRSEPVYSYQKTERDVSFTLKFFPVSEPEEEVIWSKIRFLTGLTYPTYISEPVGYGYKQRYNPPFCQMRIGEYFGNSGAGVNGFLKSLTYTTPENSPWNINPGDRRPKHITAAISFQIIGSGIPDSNSGFYGAQQYT